MDLHAYDLVAERIHANLIRQGKRLPVVFDCVLGLQIDVCVVEGAAQLGCYGFWVGGEVANDVDSIDVIYVDEHAEAEEYAVESVLAGRRVGAEGKVGIKRISYKAVARETENGYSLKSLVAASRVEACRRV